MRKSIQQAIPAAMSLPDVMMVNTGRRELSMLLPDVAKAQSYGGRVSHSYSAGNVSSCVVCQAQAVVFCRDCYLVKLGLKDGTPEPGCNECPGNFQGDPDGSKSHEIVERNSRFIDYLRCLQGDEHQCHNCQLVACETHNPQAQPCECHDITGNGIHSKSNDSKEKKCEKFEFNSSFSKKQIQNAMNESSSLMGRSGAFRLSQHRHPPREPLKSTASVKSTKSPKNNERTARHPSATSTDHTLGKEDARKRERVLSNQTDHTGGHHEEADEYDDVFDETLDTLDHTRKFSTTTDDNGFSSIPTESVYMSESGNTSKYARNKPGLTAATAVGVPESAAQLKQLTKQNGQSNFPTLAENRNGQPGAKNSNGLAGLAPYRNDAFDCSSSKSSSSVQEEDDASSGIFSAESPIRNSKEIPKPKWLNHKESQSEFAPDEPVGKQPARRVKSYN